MSRPESRYHSVSSKRIAAWLRFPRARGDGLFDCFHFARDYAENTGFLYSAEGYLSFFPELRFPPGPFGAHFALQDIIPGAYGSERPIGEYWGAGWFLLGRSLNSAAQTLATVLEVFAVAAVPRLDEIAAALLQDPVLLKAIELAEQVDAAAADARDQIVSGLRALGDTDQRGYPIGKIAAQLVWRRRGNKNWYHV
jgi:hypothetical protein